LTSSPSTRTFNVVGGFALAALLPIALLAAVLTGNLRNDARTRLLDSAKHEGAIIAAATESQLAPADLTHGLSRERFLKVDAILANLHSQGVSRVTIVDRRRRVAYSTDRRLVGKRVSLSKALAGALRGGNQLIVAPRHAGERDVVVYVPLRFGGRRAYGVAQVASPWAPLAQTLSQDTRTVYGLLLGGLALLYAMLLPIAARMSRSLRRQAKENARLALHDHLTGLPNRAQFVQRLRDALAKGDAESTAILLIDLDRFKDVNDTLGHHFGDELLRTLAHRLAGILRDCDCLARLGGDEFAVLLRGARDERTMIQVAERIASALEDPVLMDTLPIEVEASVGGAISPRHGDDAETLLRHADVAMYWAKESRSGYATYDPSLREGEPGQLALISGLRRALERGELVVHYQPQVALESGSVESVEALVRWQHPQRGLLGPDAFIPLAQHTALIGPLTLYVVHQALAQLQAWQQQGTELAVSVNIAPRNLLSADFPQQVITLVHESGLDPSRLTLELTEGAVLADPVRAGAVLRSLSEAGIRLSIDDFGRGYSSLAYLSELPVRQLKIDRRFVHSMLLDHDDAAIVRATIDLARELDLDVVAEGVETQAQADFLRRLSCGHAQGFYFARPAAPADVFARDGASTLLASA
jgi:diguanylate cyclase